MVSHLLFDQLLNWIRIPLSYITIFVCPQGGVSHFAFLMNNDDDNDRAPSSQWMSHAEDDAHRGVTSSMGMPTSIADANDIKWSPNQKRAAVLLCLFQGAGGELRVILTKRAGSLSSHSGANLMNHSLLQVSYFKLSPCLPTLAWIIESLFPQVSVTIKRWTFSYGHNRGNLIAHCSSPTRLAKPFSTHNFLRWPVDPYANHYNLLHSIVSRTLAP